MNVLKSIEKGFIKCNMQQQQKNNNTFTLIFGFLCFDNENNKQKRPLKEKDFISVENGRKKH